MIVNEDDGMMLAEVMPFERALGYKAWEIIPDVYIIPYGCGDSETLQSRNTDHFIRISKDLGLYLGPLRTVS